MGQRSVRRGLQISLCLTVPLLVGGCAWLNERLGVTATSPEATASRSVGGAGHGSAAARKQRESERRSEPRNGLAATTGEPETVGLAEPGGTAAQTASDDMSSRTNVTSPRQAGGGMVAAWVGADTTSNPETLGIDSLTGAPRGTAQGDATSRTQISARLDAVRRLLLQGKVLQARGTLETIVALAPASALHELGRTYDPYYLGQLPAIDDGSEPRKAAELYLEAISLGSPTAGGDLDRLRASYPALR